MRPTGWDPLCSLPDAPFLSSSAWGRYHTSRPDPGFPVFSPRTAGFLPFAPTLEFRTDPRGSHPPLGCFSSRPSGFSTGDTPSVTMPSAALCCNRHVSLDSFRHALHTKENFHQSTSVATYWQKTDIIHMNSKAWLWVNGPWFMFSSPQALQTSWELLFTFLIRVHYTLSLFVAFGFLHAKWRSQFCWTACVFGYLAFCCSTELDLASSISVLP